MTPIEWAIGAAVLSAVAGIASTMAYSAALSLMGAAVKWLAVAIAATAGINGLIVFGLKGKDAISNRRGDRAARRNAGSGL